MKLAKSHGVYLSVGEQHRHSEASGALIMKFLADMIALDTSIRTNQSGSVGTPVEVEDDEEEDGEDNDHEAKYSDEPTQDEDEARVSHLQAKISKLGKRGFQYNPVCRKCKMQFDLDDSETGSCVCHPGMSNYKVV